jgi:hypothetical protein
MYHLTGQVGKASLPRKQKTQKKGSDFGRYYETVRYGLGNGGQNHGMTELSVANSCGPDMSLPAIILFLLRMILSRHDSVFFYLVAAHGGHGPEAEVTDFNLDKLA